jgi:hypothetical protein
MINPDLRASNCGDGRSGVQRHGIPPGAAVGIMVSRLAEPRNRATSPAEMSSRIRKAVQRRARAPEEGILGWGKPGCEPS